jgi:alpha-ketoglutarate-dependent taurine dioxygenase
VLDHKMRKSLLRSFRKTVNASVDNVAKVLSFRDWSVPFEWILDRDISAFDANCQRGCIVSPELVKELMIESLEVEELPEQRGHKMEIKWNTTQRAVESDNIAFSVTPKAPSCSTIVVRADAVERELCSDICKKISCNTQKSPPPLTGLRGKTQVPWTSTTLVCSDDNAPPSCVVKSSRTQTGQLPASVKRSVVEAIEKHGFAVVEDPSLSQVGESVPQAVQCRFHSAEAIITDLFSFLRNSHYGAMSTWSDGTSWQEVGNNDASAIATAATQKQQQQEFSGSEAHLDGAYQSTLLDLHTDCTYFIDCPKLQAFGCILTTPTTKGGETTLADGAAAAMRLHELHPDHFDVLSRVPVGGRYHKEGRWYESHRPVISLTPCGSFIERVSFNNSDRIPMDLSLSVSELQDFYRAYYAFHKLVHQQAIRFLLKPGQILFFDNHRTLHGRLQFAGPRVMCGAYIGTDEYFSALRTHAHMPQT